MEGAGAAAFHGEEGRRAAELYQRLFLGYRYWRDAALGPEYERTLDSLFDAYAAALPRVEAWAGERFPRADGEPEAAHRRSIRAKALDLLRGLLPAAALSHVGIFASGQAYEQLILR